MPTDTPDDSPGKLKVAVPADLLNRISRAAEANGRSTTREVESRLRASLDEGGASTQDGRPSPWARALGHLMTLLADDLAAGSQSADEALAGMKAGAATLIETLLDGFRQRLGAAEIESVERDAREHASVLGQALGFKVRQAHRLEKRAEDAPSWLEVAHASLATLKQDDLRKVQTALFLSPEALGKIVPSRTKRMPRKGKK